MRIALDAMGGDFAPAATVAGAVSAAREDGLSVILVGRDEVLRQELSRHASAGLELSVVDAPEVVAMEEHAAEAFRTKPRSSVAVGVSLVQSGQASAFVSAGNSGATMVTTLFGLGRLPGIQRPALAVVLPSLKGSYLLLDVGANVDCRPQHLAEFALMGSVYSQRVLGVENPRVALLSNGEEETKGNALVQEAYTLLKGEGLNFIGNVEGKDLPLGLADVVVCDGFVGNVVLKLAEGVASTIVQMIRGELTSTFLNRLLAAGLRPAFRGVARRLDYAQYGGAPLLGVNGVCIVAHGRSSAVAISNALRLAREAVQKDLVGQIGAELARIRKGESPKNAGSY